MQWRPSWVALDPLAGAWGRGMATSCPRCSNCRKPSTWPSRIVFTFSKIPMYVFFPATDHVGPEEEKGVRVLDHPHISDSCKNFRS
jgi:hypothetical protein